MTTAHVFIGISLDGFIARPDDGLDFLDFFPVEGEDHGYHAFIAQMDGLVMGRRTYETVLGFGGDWPFAKPVIVMSRTMVDADLPQALSGKVVIHPGMPGEVLEHCESLGWQRVYIDGGQIVQAFLRAGLVEDMIISRLPVLIGQGKPLFGELVQDIRLEHLETRSFEGSGFVQSHYRVLR